MAKGFVGKFQTFLGFAGVVALVVSASLVTGINPLTYVDDAFAAAMDKLTGKLTEPLPRWAERVDGPPVAATVTSDRVVVVLNGAVEARRLSDGGHAWDRMVDWAVPAGEVVVAGRAAGGGFEVLDASTGGVRWQDARAEDAWAYQDMVLSVACRDDGDGCTMSARSTTDGARRWQRRLDGAAQRLAGYPDTDEVIERTGMLPPGHPGAAPQLVGVVADRTVTVIDTRSGQVLGELPEGADTRIVMAGNRVLGVTARPASNGGCRYTVRAWDPSGDEVWRRTGYDLGTVVGSGCEQRSDPVGAGDVVAAVGSDDRPALLGVPGGEVRWTGRPGDTLLATDGQVAVVRARDGETLTAVSAETGESLWTRTASPKATVVVTRSAVLLKDPEAGTVTALAPASGALLRRWSSQAALVGAGDAGVVLSSGRTVGYATW